MAQENNGPDLTMLALAAYNAIRKSMEEAAAPTPVHPAGQATQSGQPGTPEQQPEGFRLISTLPEGSKTRSRRHNGDA